MIFLNAGQWAYAVDDATRAGLYPTPDVAKAAAQMEFEVVMKADSARRVAEARAAAGLR